MHHEEGLSWSHCSDCLAPYRDRILKRRQALLCSRCGNVLKKYHSPGSLEASFAMVTAALVFLVMANISPIMVFDVSGNTQSNLIITGVWSLMNQGYWPIALLVFVSAIAIPAIYLSAFWYLLGSCTLNRKWIGARSTLTVVDLLASWNLIPVFAVATMAAVVKLEQLGNIEWKAGAYWLAALAFSSLIAMYTFDRHHVVRILNERD